jgi:predicted dehydrogenase
MTMQRREFLRNAAAAFAAPLFVRNLMSNPPSGRVRHASFGADGMAGSDIQSLASHPQLDLVCVAEVDATRLGRLQKRFPDGKVRVYSDWREMLDKEAKSLDSVNVSTPDHSHAPQAMSAMQLGLHAYVQKPLAHDVYEVRRLTEVAREKKLVSQMGIQVHSAEPYRLGVAVVQSGVVGKIKEVHTWSSKKWGDSGALPDRKDAVPSTLNWDVWVGVAPERPYIGGGYYHPGNWRRRLDFGTGTFGDMGCHIYDPVFEACALTAPLSVRSEGPRPSATNWANNAVIHYVFPGTRYTEGDTLRVVWYDGDERPSKEILSLLGKRAAPDQGSIFIGTKGTILLPHVGRPEVYPVEQFRDYAMPKVVAANHYHQFVDAVRGMGQCSAGFDYSGPLTEAVLLGGVATNFPKTTLEWDSAKLHFKNVADANRHIRRTYRKGWEVRGLS